jgi:LmbE family N-acetylglucosaminyl deacetylase
MRGWAPLFFIIAIMAAIFGFTGPGRSTMSDVLCFGAHADDIEFGCLGTLIQLRRGGHRVSFAILTNGESGFKAGEAPREERVRIRKEEQLEESRRLGLEEVIFLDHRDGHLVPSEELMGQLVEILRRHRPDRVYSFDPANQAFDNINLFHRDHRVAARAVFDACFVAKNRWILPGHPHRVEEIHFFGSREPDHFVDISDVIDLKLELLACHRSQFTDFERVGRYIRERISGPHGDYTQSEGFRILKVEQIA